MKKCTISAEIELLKLWLIAGNAFDFKINRRNINYKIQKQG